MNFEAFLWSLTQQESGGNYRAVGVWVGGDRAYGRYQVMGANIPSWTAKYYGRRLTPQQYLYNNAAQDAVVRGRLREYVRKYGYRGAASAWYSGNPRLHMSTRSQYGGPSIKGYVDSVMSRARRYKGGGGGGGGYRRTSPGGPAWQPEAVKPHLDEKTLAEMYGLTSRLINSSKELKKVFNKAVEGQWSEARFQAALKNTNWWKKQPSSLRKYLMRKYNDPATHKQQYKHVMYALNRLAVEVGLKSQIKGGKPSEILKEAIYNKMGWDWTDARLKDWFGGKVRVHDGAMYGEAGQVYDKLHAIAYANGMRYKDWYLTAVRAVVSGKSTIEREEAKIRRDAAARFDSFAEQIKAGQNALDLAAPYIKSVSTILEIPETDIDLFDKYVYNAMAGGHAGENFPLWEFERIVRKDDRWKKTNNARESMLGIARQVAKDFGVAF